MDQVEEPILKRMAMMYSKIAKVHPNPGSSDDTVPQKPEFPKLLQDLLVKNKPNLNETFGPPEYAKFIQPVGSKADVFSLNDLGRLGVKVGSLRESKLLY
jgi:hypothetical protein